jgi:hypothetical protein
MVEEILEYVRPRPAPPPAASGYDLTKRIGELQAMDMRLQKHLVHHEGKLNALRGELQSRIRETEGLDKATHPSEYLRVAEAKERVREAEQELLGLHTKGASIARDVDAISATLSG